VQQRTEGEEAGAPHFGLLHVIREYALERLEASGEAEALRRAHAAHCLALAERAELELTGPEAATWLERLEREHDNLRAALSWARAQGEEAAETGLRLVAALWRFWWVRGHLREGRAWVAGLPGLAGAGAMPTAGAGVVSGTEGVVPTVEAVSAVVRARALLAGGVLAVWQGDFAVAAPWLEQAVVQAAGDPRTAALALNYLGVMTLLQGDWERAAMRLEASLALMREVGDQWGIALALTNLGNVAVYQGDLERAAATFTEALTLSRQGGDHLLIAACLENLGWVARKRGEVAQAEALQREALALAQDLGDRRTCVEALELLAATAGAAGQGARAARLLGAAATLRETLGAPQPPEERADIEQAVAAVRAALGEAAWRTAFAAGRELSLERAIAEALGEVDEGEESRV
jgi:non-specific serine/threonine protein kinase